MSIGSKYVVCREVGARSNDVESATEIKVYDIRIEHRYVTNVSMNGRDFTTRCVNRCWLCIEDQGFAYNVYTLVCIRD